MRVLRVLTHGLNVTPRRAMAAVVLAKRVAAMAEMAEAVDPPSATTLKDKPLAARMLPNAVECCEAADTRVSPGWLAPSRPAALIRPMPAVVVEPAPETVVQALQPTTSPRQVLGPWAVAAVVEAGV